MGQIKMSQKEKKECDKKMENDIKWCTFVTKRANMSKKMSYISTVREKLKDMMNPFSQELVVEVDIRLSPDAKIVDPVYGEMPASTELEKAKSTKVYKSAELRDRTMNLSATAMRMLWFIVYEIEGSDDWVELDPEWYKEVSQAGSRNMYAKGKEELVRYGYISRTECKNIYWVNPALVYGGNRVKKYENKVVVKNTFMGRKEVRRKEVRRKPSNTGTGMKLAKKKVYLYPDDDNPISAEEREYMENKAKKK